MGKKHIKLSEKEHNYLIKLTSSGELKARKFKRVMTLFLLNEGKTMAEVSKLLYYSYPSVIALRNRYLAMGLECLNEKNRSGRPILIDGLAKDKINNLSNSTPPDGCAGWSLRLLAKKAVELGLVKGISHSEVGRILKSQE